jgi:hypothetical protein
VLSTANRRQNLQLPRPGNPRTREWARYLREQYEDDHELVQAMLQYFNQQPYHYTLKPPLLGENSVDEFLFDTRSGFCEHYSSAMTFALRAAGIPARVVTGYQGGELNSAGNYMQVRQMDAHAWVEYWLQDAGWQRADPTFQVAPERIELGLQEALRDESVLLDTSVFSPIRYRHVAWLNKMRMGWENLNHSWQVKVLGYQGEQQQAWLRKLFGSVNWQYIGIGLVAGLAVLIGLLAFCLLKPWRNRPDPLQKVMQRFDRLMARQHLERKAGEGLRGFQQRCRNSGQLSEPQQQALNHFIALHESIHYAGLELETDTLAEALAGLTATFPRSHSFARRAQE